MNNDIENQEIPALAREIMNNCRNSLFLSLRFMGVAVGRLYLKSTDKIQSIATDGQYLFYNDKWVLKRFKEEPSSLVRDYLHIIMHCIFSHSFSSVTMNRDYWDVACDLAVENMINELNVDKTNSERAKSQSPIISYFASQFQPLTAEKIYRYMIEKEYSRSQVEQLRKAFSADSHDMWYDRTLSAEIVGTNGDGDVAGESSNARIEEPMSLEEIREAWNKTSESVKVDMKTSSKAWGEKSANFMASLDYVTRDKYDYTDFLKRFAVMGEKMIVDNDSFDYIFYTYGLELYENVPLIEPLEYKEVKSIKEFVIAIDTSGSCSGELVQQFLNKTYSILKTTESFFSKINIHIIQCDAKIQKDTKITCQEDFDEFIDNIELFGFGGTDFRPVFEYVEKLKEEKEFTNLKGMIYFTDGFGTFPAKKPNYETAFVFMNNDYNVPDVPPWAIKLIFSDDDIREL